MPLQYGPPSLSKIIKSATPTLSSALGHTALEGPQAVRMTPTPRPPAPQPLPAPGLPSPTGAPAAVAPPPFDFYGAIMGDPLRLQQARDLSTQSVADAGTRRAQTNQAITQFGEVPDFTSSIQGLGLDPNSPMYQMLFGDIGPDTARTAQDMTTAGLSTTAQLNKTHQKALGDLLDQMAARGTVQSGATGVGTTLENQAFSGNQFKARSDLLTYLSGVQSAFNQSEQARQGQLAQGYQDAAQRQIGLNPTVPTVGA